MMTAKTITVPVVGTSDDHGRKAGETLREEQRCMRTTIFNVLRALEEEYPFIALLLDAISGYKITKIGIEQSSSYPDELGLEIALVMPSRDADTTLYLYANEERIFVSVHESGMPSDDRYYTTVYLDPNEQGKPTVRLSRAETSLKAILTRWGQKA